RASFVRTNVVSGTSPASLAEFADGSVPPSPAEAAGPERPTSVAVSAPPRDDVMSCPSCGVVSSQLTDAPHFVGGAEVLRELLLRPMFFDDERAPAHRDGLDVRAFGALVVAIGEGQPVLPGRRALEALRVVVPDGVPGLGRAGCAGPVARQGAAFRVLGADVLLARVSERGDRISALAAVGLDDRLLFVR